MYSYTSYNSIRERNTDDFPKYPTPSIFATSFLFVLPRKIIERSFRCFRIVHAWFILFMVFMCTDTFQQGKDKISSPLPSTQRKNKKNKFTPPGYHHNAEWYEQHKTGMARRKKKDKQCRSMYKEASGQYHTSPSLMFADVLCRHFVSKSITMPLRARREPCQQDRQQQRRWRS